MMADLLKPKLRAPRLCERDRHRTALLSIKVVLEGVFCVLEGVLFLILARLRLL